MKQIDQDVLDVTNFFHLDGSLYPWTPDIISLYKTVKWYVYHQQAAIVREKSGGVVAVCLAHTANYRKKNTIDDLWRTQRDGNTIHIMHAASLHPLCVPIGWRIIVRLFGMRKYVTMYRNVDIVAHPLKRYRMEHFDRKMNFMEKKFQPLKPVNI